MAIEFDLTPMIEKGYTVGVLRQAETAWWFLFDCLKKDSLKTMVRQAGSPSKAFRALRDHFLPLSKSQIRVQEEKLKSLRMRSGENPSTFSHRSGRRSASFRCLTSIRMIGRSAT